MTDKELRRLKKIELLDILIAQDEELEDLRKRLSDAEHQLARSNAVINKVLARIPETVFVKRSEPAAKEITEEVT